ncbi:hypothetical protein KJY77_06490 [Canibacter sp. lx-72]|uniref:hypothetical protein n=1 Tax=Canibacter zhuwentaonis TaxID=2837491 RepID=UPI001BDD1CD7|nr:hypothetical protein [Canibacter zhuwentaonis]MBT1018778.1 hypothetical protein [Canibacter zhuwentaonis]
MHGSLVLKGFFRGLVFVELKLYTVWFCVGLVFILLFVCIGGFCFSGFGAGVGGVWWVVWFDFSGGGGGSFNGGLFWMLGSEALN